MTSVIPANRAGLFRDFCRFARAQIMSGDIDPTYPVLKRVYSHDHGADANAALWRTLLYVGWYHLDSAQKVWRIFQTPAEWRARYESLPVLPTGIERRGVRGEAGLPRVASFINGVLDASRGDLSGWLLLATERRTPEDGWRAVRALLEAVPYAGPWASFKWADLLKNVHGLPIDAPDIGVGGGGETSGPVPGMVRLTGLPWQECAGTPAHQRRLLSEAREAGVPFGGLDQLETALCDFNSLCRGSYYCGHDIDMQQTTLPPSMSYARDVFPARYRGELMGWTGVRHALKVAYRDAGRVVNT